MNIIINNWYIKVRYKLDLNGADIISQQMNEQSSNMLIIKYIVDCSLPRRSCFTGLRGNEF